MAKGARYTGEFKEKAVRLPAEESRSLYSPGANAIVAVAKDLGIAPESLRCCRCLSLNKSACREVMTLSWIP